MTSVLSDVYIMAGSRVLTIVANVPGNEWCEIVKAAGAMLSSRKNTTELLRRTGANLYKFQETFMHVPASCGSGNVDVEAKVYRKHLN